MTRARKSKTPEKPQRIAGDDDFILKGKDWTSPMCILFWMAMNVNTVSDEKLTSAFEMVLRTRKVIGRRQPD